MWIGRHSGVKRKKRYVMAPTQFPGNIEASDFAAIVQRQESTRFGPENPHSAPAPPKIISTVPIQFLVKPPLGANGRGSSGFDRRLFQLCNVNYILVVTEPIQYCMLGDRGRTHYQHF